MEQADIPTIVNPQHPLEHLLGCLQTGGLDLPESRLSETMKVLAVLLTVCLLASDGERIVRRTAYSHQDQMKVLPKNALRGSTNHFKKLIGRDFPPQAELEALATEKPEIASTYLLGKSVQVGRWFTLKLNLKI